MTPQSPPTHPKSDENAVGAEVLDLTDTDRPMQRSIPGGLLRTARPKQWVKNILVFAAPAAAGVLFDAPVLRKAALAFVVFALASVGTYFVNDISDYEADRTHPKKRNRPIAAGVVGIPLACAVAALSIALSLGLAAAFSGWRLSALLAGYIALTFSYSTWLKRVAVIDLGCVAAGFVLRMIAGGIATDVYISNWFLTVASFSSLFVVAGKRYAEITEMGEGRSASRAVLKDYTPAFLRTTCGVAMAVAVSAYCQWAFDRADLVGDHVWYQLSAVPWVLSLLRYSLLLERGEGGAPEEVLLGDRTMQILGFVWLVFFGLGVYVH